MPAKKPTDPPEPETTKPYGDTVEEVRDVLDED